MSSRVMLNDVISTDRWHAVRAAVEVTGERFAALVERAPRLDAKAIGHWSVIDTAAHVAGIAWMYTSQLDSAHIPWRASRFATTTVNTVAEFNEFTLRQFTERNPVFLADGLRTDIGRILQATADADPAQPVPWLGDSKLPLAGVLAHLLNELLIHGRDIARPLRTRWDIPAEYAALFFDLFIVGMLQHDTGQWLETDEPPRERRIAINFRSAYTDPVTLVLHRGVASVEEPGGRPDVRVRFDPATLNLMLFGRISKARAMLTGKIAVRGKPWLLFPFLRVVRPP